MRTIALRQCQMAMAIFRNSQATKRTSKRVGADIVHTFSVESPHTVVHGFSQSSEAAPQQTATTTTTTTTPPRLILLQRFIHYLHWLLLCSRLSSTVRSVLFYPFDAFHLRFLILLYAITNFWLLQTRTLSSSSTVFCAPCACVGHPFAERTERTNVDDTVALVVRLAPGRRLSTMYQSTHTHSQPQPQPTGEYLRALMLQL